MAAVRVRAGGRGIGFLVGSGFLFWGLEASGAASSEKAFGLTLKSAIEVCEPRGQRAYLSRLICADGRPPEFERIGSMGLRNEFPSGMSEKEKQRILNASMGMGRLEPGSLDHHVVDAYSVTCESGSSTVYLDMYHCDTPAPDVAPDGFSIQPD